MITRTNYLLARIACALAIFSALLGSTAPSPLYPVYIARFGLTQFAATAVFAAYAVGTLGALFLVPRLLRYTGDHKSILMSGLAFTAAGALIFAAAHVEWLLFLGRFLNGAGTGVVAGLASTALIELAPLAGRRLAATVATLAFTGGAAAGPVITSAALATNVAPTVAPFLAITVVTLLSFLCMLLSRWPEPGEQGYGVDASDIATQGTPDTILGPAPALFRLACLSIAVAWMIGSVLMALGANLGIEVYHLGSASVAGLIPALFQLFAGIGQAVWGRTESLRAIAYGAAGIVLTQIALVLAAPGAHGLVLMLAMPLCGFFYGALFVGALALAGAAAPPRHRAAYIARFYTVGYLSNAVPTVGLGLLTDTIGLGDAFYVFSAVLLGLAALTVALARSQRPPVSKEPGLRLGRGPANAPG